MARVGAAGGDATRRGTRPRGGRRAPSVRRQLAEGFAYLFRTGWLFATLAFATLYVLVVMGPIEVLLPFAIRDRVGAGPGACRWCWPPTEWAARGARCWWPRCACPAGT
jgi:hypothetical protein